MEIASAGALASARTRNLWQAARAGRQAAGTQTPSALAGLSAVTARAASASNMLATNFVQSDYQRSTYLSATMDSFQTEKNVTNSMDSLLGSLAAQYKLAAADMQASGGDSQYLAATLMQRRVENGVAQVVRQDVADGAEQTFQDLKDNIEGQAAAAGTQAGTEQAASAAATAAQATAAASGGTGEGTASAAATAAAAQAFAAVANAVAEAPAQPALDVAV